MNLKRRIDHLEVRAASAAARPPHTPMPLARPADVVALLAEQADAVRADPAADPLDRARTLGFVAAQALKAMDAAEGRARLESLERALKLRADHQRAEAKRLQDQRRK